MKKHLVSLTALLALLISFGSAVSAHVVVKPAEVGVAAFQTFTVGVPNEKDQNVTGIRIVVPDGLGFISPTVKPGWTIETKKQGEGESATVTEISWTGGVIPAGQRDDFTFSAQVPASATSLAWKAYQTYADGTVVSWDQDPSTIKSGEEGTPYSVTKVVNDLAATSADQSAGHQTPLWLGIIATALSLIALAVALSKK